MEGRKREKGKRWKTNITCRIISITFPTKKKKKKKKTKNLVVAVGHFHSSKGKRETRKRGGNKTNVHVASRKPAEKFEKPSTGKKEEKKGAKKGTLWRGNVWRGGGYGEGGFFGKWRMADSTLKGGGTFEKARGTWLPMTDRVQGVTAQNKMFLNTRLTEISGE